MCRLAARAALHFSGRRIAIYIHAGHRPWLQRPHLQPLLLPPRVVSCIVRRLPVLPARPLWPLHFQRTAQDHRSANHSADHELQSREPRWSRSTLKSSRPGVDERLVRAVFGPVPSANSC
jgi:hypothetical protein